MKKRVLSVFLAVLMCFSCFGSLSSVATANISWYDYLTMPGWVKIYNQTSNKVFNVVDFVRVCVDLRNMITEYNVSRDDFEEMLFDFQACFDLDGNFQYYILDEKYSSVVNEFQASVVGKTLRFAVSYYGKGIPAFVEYLYGEDYNKVSTDDLKEDLIAQNYLYTPKSSGVFKHGYRSEKYIARFGGPPVLRFYNRDFGFCEQGYTDLWFVPYLLTEDGELMLSQYQFHIYFAEWVPENPETDTNRYCIRMDYYSYVESLEGALLESYYILYKSSELAGLPSYLLMSPYYSSNGSTYRPFCIGSAYNGSLANYLSGAVGSEFSDFISSSFYSSDLKTSIIMDYYYSPWTPYRQGFCKDYADNPLKTADIGFLCSGTQIQFKYDFDISRLPTNSTVTISGDSVYDYSITDNSTGDTTTINEYVTNNYNYSPADTSGSGGNGGSGGSIDGKIEVGGKVEVGGDVKVDVNVNVNGNGGGGVTANPGDYIGDTSGVDTDIAGYIELIPQTSKNFIDFMKDFFSWLPPPIFGLIVFGFVLLVARIVLKR